MEKEAERKLRIWWRKRQRDNLETGGERGREKTENLVVKEGERCREKTENLVEKEGERGREK